jgi:phosphoglycolate phosphatase-like HAD superfamily hydrolase
MAILDDTDLADSGCGIEVVNRLGRRAVTHVLHDVDGTHSLIREWPPVMSAVLGYAMACGLSDDFDAPEHEAQLVEQVGSSTNAELLRFCEDSAGLSSLTQMEFGIRRALLAGTVADQVGPRLTGRQQALNAEVLRRIEAGEERFEELDESPELLAFIEERAPRLFRLYENVLHRACRNANTEAARRNPSEWRVPGSLNFLEHLREMGCVNYFVTGSVLRKDGGMAEEVEALGYDVGPGRLVECMVGADGARKTPKDEIMRLLLDTEGIHPANCLVVGDGRSEIEAGVSIGAAAMSRLPLEAVRRCEIHRNVGTNYIVPDFRGPVLRKLIRKE